jgi:hypothetical protein
MATNLVNTIYLIFAGNGCARGWDGSESSYYDGAMASAPGKKVTVGKKLLFRVKRKLGVERLWRNPEKLSGLGFISRGGGEGALNGLAFRFG